MSFVEKHGKSLAVALCAASFLPGAAAILANEETEGWHGARYVKNDSTQAAGWQEVDGKNYYFSQEEGTVDKQTTLEGTTAAVTTTNLQTVREIFTESIPEPAVSTVQENADPAPAEAKKEQPAQDAAEEQTSVADPVIDQIMTAEETEPAEVPVISDEQIPAEQPEIEQVVVEQPATEQIPVEQPAEEQIPVEEPAQEPVVTPEEVIPEVEIQPEEPEVEAFIPEEPEVQAPIEQEPEVEMPSVETPAPEEVVEVPAENQYASLNDRIVEAAKSLVGVTDGWSCTEVVQQALSDAGVSDAQNLWPAEYQQYGYVTDSPVAGNLIYYNYPDEVGYDHIAVYIGDGMAVHGNYSIGDGASQTVIASVMTGDGAPTSYIQVSR